MTAAIVHDDDLKPWERQWWETPKQWQAFLAFLRLRPTDRSVLRAWQAVRGETGAKSRRRRMAPARFRSWATNNRWRERAAAWDRAQEHVALAAFARERQAELAEQMHVARLARSASLARLTELAQRPTGIPAAVACRLLFEGARLEREAFNALWAMSESGALRPVDFVAIMDDVNACAASRALDDLLRAEPARRRPALKVVRGRSTVAAKRALRSKDAAGTDERRVVAG